MTGLCVNQLALTFGTLLSSQGTDAHPFGSSDPFEGNPLSLCRLRLGCPLGVSPVPASSESRRPHENLRTFRPGRFPVR